MELRHLRYFVAVADALSFTKGAEYLHLSQPSLTRQIKDLEAELGVRLLDRTKQRVALTEEGHSFLADAKRVLALSAEIVDSVQRLSRHEIASLSIGYVANLFYDLLPASLSAFQRALPTVSVNLFNMSCGDQFRALHDGTLDLGFVGFCDAARAAGFQHRVVATYKTVAALNEAHPLAGKAVVKLKALASMFFIGMSENGYPGYRLWLTTTCRQVGFNPKVLQDVDIERTVLQSVAAGLGVALLPDQVKNLPHQDVVFRPISPTVPIESCLAWKAENPSPAMKTYLEIVKKLGASMRLG
jgi:DNA-binding transcriptional LysR family regulator